MCLWGESGSNLRYESVSYILGLAMPGEYGPAVALQYRYYAIRCWVCFDLAIDKAMMSHPTS
jgi:hypothetical protein